MSNSVPSKNSTFYGLKNNLSITEWQLFGSSTKAIFSFKLEDLEKIFDDVPIFLYVVFLEGGIIRFTYSYSDTYDFASNSNLFIEGIPRDFNHSCLNNQQVTQLLNFTDVELTDMPGTVIIKTSLVHLTISKYPLNISITDLDANVLFTDLVQAGYCRRGQSEIRSYIEIHDKYNAPCIYGLGDKTGEINRWGRRFINSPVDALGYDGANTDPMYKDIPFFIVREFDSQYSYGIFFDNPYIKFFDFGKETKPSNSFYFGAEAGELNYYFIHGPKLRDVSKKYIKLTGMPPLVPYFTTKYLGSGMSYTEEINAQENLITFFENVAENKIDVGAFHLSSGYCLSNLGERHQFIWSKQRFKTPKNFFEHMLDKYNAEFCANLKPALLLSHPLYSEAKSLDIFIKKKNSHEPLVIDYWGGKGSLIDFFAPNTKVWWLTQLKKAFFDNGINGIWNDNNEYETYGYEQDSTKISQQSLEMTKLSFEASLENNTNKRPWILTRSGYAGIQAYAQTWTGDNYSDFKALKFDNAIISSMSISGLIHTGCDIGGFWGASPNTELLMRWIQNGVFSPRFCIHSYKDIPTEAWQCKDTEPNIYQYIQAGLNFRRALQLYIYNSFYRASVEGIPVQRPLIYDFDCNQFANESFNYLFGETLLILPVLEKNTEYINIYLPGDDSFAAWVDLRFLVQSLDMILSHGNLNSIKGINVGIAEHPIRSQQSIEVDENTIPVFAKSNSILYIENYYEHDSLLLFLILSKSDFIENKTMVSTTIYLDDGVSLDYLQGAYNIINISVEVSLTNKNTPVITKINYEELDSETYRFSKLEYFLVYGGKLYRYESK